MNVRRLPRRATAAVVMIATTVAAILWAHTGASAAGSTPVPGYVRVWESDQGADVTWAAAVPDALSHPVDKYIVTREPDGVSVEVPADTRTTHFTGLVPGQQYTFEVRAVNLTGTGQPAVSPEFTAVARAGVPRDLTVQPGDGKITATWDAPADTGGSPVEEYVVSLGPEHGERISVGPESRSATINGLTNGTTYPVVVWAVTKAGPGRRAAAQAVLVKPDDVVVNTTILGPTVAFTTVPHQNAQVRFNTTGLGYSYLRIQFPEVSYPSGTTMVSILRWDGTVLNGPVQLRPNLELYLQVSINGPYTVLVDPQGEAVGSAKARVEG